LKKDGRNAEARHLFSSLLFILLVMNILGKILFRAEDGVHLYGFQVEHGPKGVITITHFLFAIDAFLFCNGTTKNLG
jgi:hypothetical protein